MRWKYLSGLIAIATLWTATGHAQNQRSQMNAWEASEPTGQISQRPVTRFAGNDPSSTSTTGELSESRANVSAVASNGAQQTDTQLKAHILRLFTLTKVMETIQRQVQASYSSLRPVLLRLLPETPHRDEIADEFGRKMVAIVTLPEFEDQLVTVYAKYFDDAQIKSLIQFYQSPIGQHYVAVQAPLETDVRQAGVVFSREHVPAIYLGLCSEYPELQGKAEFCPASPQKTPGSQEPSNTNP